MTVIVPLEIKELHFQISGRPEERVVQTFAPKGSNQAFDEWMRERRVRDDHGIALTLDEERRLIAACEQSRSPSLLPAFVLALQTGLRYTELRLLRWSQVDLLGSSAEFVGS